MQFWRHSSRALGQMQLKLAVANFIDFTHARARAAVAEWLKAAVLET